MRRVTCRLWCRCISLLRRISLLWLLLIGINTKPPDGGKHATVMLSPVDASVDGHTLPRLEVVKHRHFVAGELHGYEVGMQHAIAARPRVVKDNFPLLERIATRLGGYLLNRRY